MSDFLKDNKKLLVGLALGTVFGTAVTGMVMSGVAIKINNDWHNLSTKSIANMLSACQKDIQNIENNYKSGQQPSQSSETWSSGDTRQIVIQP